MSLCSLIRDLCDAHEVLTIADCPQFARQMLGQATIERTAELFFKGKMETIDFCDQLHVVVRKLDVDTRWLVKHLAPVFPDAARYLRRHYGYSRSMEEDFPKSSNADKIDFKNPSCNGNKKLHHLIEGVKSFDLSEERQMSDFFDNFVTSPVFALLLQFNDVPSIGIRDDVQFISVRSERCVGLLPMTSSVDDDYVKTFFRKLRRSTAGKRIATRSPNSLVRFLASRRIEDIPSNLVEIDKAVLQLGNWQRPNVAELSKRLTGEEFCVRASAFTLSSVTSAEARRHEEIRISLAYAFAKKYHKLICATPLFMSEKK